MTIISVGVESRRDGLYRRIADQCGSAYFPIAPGMGHIDQIGALCSNANDDMPPSLLVINAMVPHFNALVAQAKALSAPLFILADSVENRLPSILATFAAGASDIVCANDHDAAVFGRITALIAARRAGPALIAAQLQIDKDQMAVRLDGRNARLTAKEHKLLTEFAAHANLTLSRTYLIRAVWGWHHPPSTRTLDMHVSRLRRKLGLAARSNAATLGTPIIRTIFGYGYRLELPLL